MATNLESIERAVKDLTGKARVGEWKTVIIAASGTISSVADLGGNFAYLQVVIPTITSAQLELQVQGGDNTYQDFGQNALTEVGTGAFNDTWVLGGWQFIKIKSSAAQTSAVTFSVRGVTY